jgi:RHS repeat-associated protein
MAVLHGNRDLGHDTGEKSVTLSLQAEAVMRGERSVPAVIDKITGRTWQWLRLLLSLMIGLASLLSGLPAVARPPAPTAAPVSAGGGWGSGGAGTTLYSTPVEGCYAQMLRYDASATFKPPVRVSNTKYACKWTNSNFNPNSSEFFCRSGYAYYAPGQCLAKKPLAEQCCEDGATREPSAPPSPSTPHPVSIGSGAKTWAEEDYTSEDGLLTVQRNYRSRLRGAERISFKEPDRFGAHWQGTIPGPLVFGTSAESEVEYLSEYGGLSAFVSTTDPADMTFKANSAMASEHRLKLEIVAAVPVGMGRKDFIETAPVSAAGAGEFRVEFPNGDYTLYRRPTASANDVGVRNAVPVEHGKASGYKQYFDYDGDSPVPYRLRDSFGRQIGIQWDVTNDIPNRLGVSERAIKKLTLPDSSYLEYDYDDGIGKPNPLGIASTSGASGGSISFVYGATVYSKTRLRTVKRKSAAGATLWSRKYLYEDTVFPFALSGIEDSDGRRLTTYTYDAQGDVLSTESAGGADRHEFTRTQPSATRLVRTVKGPLGHVATYEFDIPATIKRYSIAKLLSVKGAANGSVAADEVVYSYSGNRIASVTDRRGTVSALTNDPTFGRPTLVKDAAGNVAEQQTGITWHPVWDLPVSEQRDGLRIDNGYDAQGRLTSTTATDTTTHSVPYATAGEARTTSYSWTAQGKLEQINNPLSPDALGRDDTTTFGYDTSGNLTSVTNALGHITSFAGHDANGRPASMTDANNVITAFGYDLLGRMTSVAVKHPSTASLDAVTSLEYDGEGRVTGITLPQTAKLIVDYSVIGRVTALRSGDGERIDFVYDRMGNVTQRTVKRSNGSATLSIKASFDALGRLLTETLGVGRPRAFQYDKEGNVTAVTDPRDVTSTRGLDALGRLVSTANPDGGVEAFTYNKRDEQISFKDAIDVTTTFVRNGFGEVIQEVSPDRGTSTYTYDAAGRMASEIDGRGQRIDYAYDIAGRLLSKTPVGRPASEAIVYAYDSGGLGSHQVGRLTSVSDGTGIIRFGYDHRGNLTERQQSVGTTSVEVLGYAYDLADRITGMTYPSGRELRYSREAKGRVGGAETRSSPAAPWVSVASNMTYQPFSAVETVALGNGLSVTNERSLDGRLKTRRLTNTATSTALSALSYVYDPDGNVASIDDAVIPERSAVYGYDAMGRMNMMVAEGAASNASYTTTAGTNRLASLTTPAGTRAIQYDGRGNPLSETRPGSQSVALDYDGYGRLTSYARSGEASLTHAYNGLDDRVATTTTTGTGTDTRRFVYAPDGRVIGEYGTSAADVKAEFIWARPEVGDAGSFGGDDGLGGYMPLALAVPTVTEPDRLLWIHGNHMGVPLVFTDASGTEVSFPTGFSLPGFPGQSRTLSDLYYNRYRDYDPTTGRYIQADPIGLAGGANPYSYAMNNPLRYSDPTGEFVPLLVIGFLIWFDIDLIQQRVSGKRAWSWQNAYCDEVDIDFGSATFEGALGAIPSAKVFKWLKFSKRFNPFKGKTPTQIDDMLRKKGYQPKGPDPLSGRGTYVNPKNGRPYHIDANHPLPKPPHVGAGRPRGPARDNLPTRDFEI